MSQVQVVQGSHISRSHLWPRGIRRRARSHHRFADFQPRLGCTPMGKPMPLIPMGKPWADLMGTDRTFRNGGCLGTTKSLCFKVLRWKKRVIRCYTMAQFRILYTVSLSTSAWIIHPMKLEKNLQVRWSPTVPLGKTIHKWWIVHLPLYL